MSSFFNEYWTNQNSSGQRHSDASFLKNKADEHVSLMTSSERLHKCLDIGCGAGELLVELIKLCNIVEAIDYSQPMLDVTKKRLDTINTDISLSVIDAKQYIKETECSIWMACQSINQYLPQKEIESIFVDFIKSPNAISFFLFDTIDPDKYQLWKQGRTRYDNFFPSRKEIIKSNLQEIAGVITRQYEKVVIPIGEMGYAYRPHFWSRLIKEYNIKLHIVSSQAYEYRYHVILRKTKSMSGG